MEGEVRKSSLRVSYKIIGFSTFFFNLKPDPLDHLKQRSEFAFPQVVRNVVPANHAKVPDDESCQKSKARHLSCHVSQTRGVKKEIRNRIVNMCSEAVASFSSFQIPNNRTAKRTVKKPKSITRAPHKLI